ncbi:MAG: cytochrome c peroxidase [Saprospiraceae bacterium]
MKKNYLLPLLFGAVLLLAACNKDADFKYYHYSDEDYALLSQYLDLPDLPYNYAIQSPVLFGNVQVKPPDPDLATLGRVLFYDKHLSKDGTISCASCHQQEFAFGDNKAVSEGVFQRQGDRNSIALMSVASFASNYGTDLNGPGGKRFFWDNRAETAVEQSIGSMTNPKEMNMTMQEIVAAVKAQPYYEPLFRQAFDNPEITQDNVTAAIAEFVNSIGSLNSRFDIALDHNRKAGKFDPASFPFDDFSPLENKGKALFMLNCSNCHGTDMVNAPFMPSLNGSALFLSDGASNGLDELPADAGIGGFTGLQFEMGTFKTPSLRNVGVSAPYMHDGRFATLEEVIDHYSTGIKPHVNLNAILKNQDGTPKRMNFTDDDKKALVAFLHTLTDETVLNDVKFSNPFKY